MSLKRTANGYRHKTLPVVVYREAEPNYPWVIALEHDEGPAVYARTLRNASDFLDHLAVEIQIQDRKG